VSLSPFLSLLSSSFFILLSFPPSPVVVLLHLVSHTALIPPEIGFELLSLQRERQPPQRFQILSLTYDRRIRLMAYIRRFAPLSCVYVHGTLGQRTERNSTGRSVLISFLPISISSINIKPLIYLPCTTPYCNEYWCLLMVLGAS
jgi:hypothetical protein